MDPAPQNAAGGDANERDARRHCVVDEGDEEIAFGANGDDNVRVYTPNEFRDNPFYVPSNRSTEEYKHQDSMAHKKVIPDKFAGKISSNDYKPHFDVCRLLNRWDDVEAGRYLATRLQGPALKVLNNIPLGLQLTYTELSAQLERRFGPGGQAENFLLELRSRRPQPRESLQELGKPSETWLAGLPRVEWYSTGATCERTFQRCYRRTRDQRWKFSCPRCDTGRRYSSCISYRVIPPRGEGT